MWLPALVAIGGMIGLWQARSRRLALCFCTAEEDDSDMKIVGEPSKQPSKRLYADPGDLAAIDFANHKRNGNIDRAYRLGEDYAKAFVAEEVMQDIDPEELGMDPKVLSDHLNTLFAFAVYLTLEYSDLNTVITHTALNHFHEVVAEKFPDSNYAMLRNAAYSAYLVCVGSDKDTYDGIGKVFATLCGREGDRVLSDIGERLFDYFVDLCKRMQAEADFQ